MEFNSISTRHNNYPEIDNIGIRNEFYFEGDYASGNIIEADLDELGLAGGKTLTSGEFVVPENMFAVAHSTRPYLSRQDLRRGRDYRL